MLLSKGTSTFLGGGLLAMGRHTKAQENDKNQTPLGLGGSAPRGCQIWARRCTKGTIFLAVLFLVEVAKFWLFVDPPQGVFAMGLHPKAHQDTSPSGASQKSLVATKAYPLWSIGFPTLLQF